MAVSWGPSSPGSCAPGCSARPRAGGGFKFISVRSRRPPDRVAAPAPPRSPVGLAPLSANAVRQRHRDSASCGSELFVTGEQSTWIPRPEPTRHRFEDARRSEAVRPCCAAAVVFPTDDGESSCLLVERMAARTWNDPRPVLEQTARPWSPSAGARHAPADVDGKAARASLRQLQAKSCGPRTASPCCTLKGDRALAPRANARLTHRRRTTALASTACIS